MDVFASGARRPLRRSFEATLIDRQMGKAADLAQAEIYSLPV